MRLPRRRLSCVALGTGALVVLTACTDPMTAGLYRGEDGSVTVLLDPCRPTFWNYDTFSVVNAKDGSILWKVASATGSPVDLHEVRYGIPPIGTTAQSPAAPLPSTGDVQFRYEGSGQEPTLQTFTLQKLRAGRVLRYQDGLTTLAAFQRCDK